MYGMPKAEVFTIKWHPLCNVIQADLTAENLIGHKMLEEYQCTTAS